MRMIHLKKKKKKKKKQTMRKAEKHIYQKDVIKPTRMRNIRISCGVMMIMIHLKVTDK